MNNVLLPLFFGFGAGILSSWGIGGGTLLLLAMTMVLHVEQHTAQGINLLFFLPTAISALVLYWRHGHLDKKILRIVIPPALAGALLGSLAAAVWDSALLRRPFGLYLLLSGATLLKKKKKDP